MNRTSFVAAVVLLLGQLAATANAQPSISGLSPGSIAPGTTTEVTIQGAKLDRPLQIWTSFPATVEIVPPANEEEAKKNDAIKCKITPAEGVAVGVVGIAVGNKVAASGIHMFTIDDAVAVAESGDNHAPDGAQELSLPAGVEGTIDGSTRDYFCFQAGEGQRVAVEVLASRLGSAMDPVIRLIDPNGLEVAAVDDVEGLGADCRLSHVCKAAGRYVVEVADNKFQGGLRYRLRVGDFPIVTAPFPLGIQLGGSIELAFIGEDEESTESQQLTVAADFAGHRLAVGARLPGGTSSAMTVAAVDSLTEQLESEPNNETGQATAATFPGAVSGGLQAAGDEDYYLFAGKQGQVLNFQSLTRSLGSAAYVQLKLLDADGKQLAATSVSDADELSLRYSIPADANYQLVVSDLLRRGGPNYVYRVSATLGNSFSLSLKNDKATINQFTVGMGNGAFAFPITVGRVGYDGPITISLQPAIEGAQIWNAEIAAGAKEARPIVVIPAGLEEGELRFLRVVGTATVDGQPQTVVMNSEGWLRTTLPAMLYPPAWYDGLLSVASSTPLEPFYDFKAPTEAVMFPRQVGEINWPLTLERKQKEFTGAVNVFFRGLPEGFSASLKADKEAYTVTIKGPADAPLGDLAFRMECFGDMAGKGQTLMRDVVIKVSEPLTVTVTPVDALLAGQKQKVKIQVTRLAGSEAQDVVLTWTKLPPGVSGDESITIPKDKNEIEVELSAAADAAIAVFEELTIQAKSTFAGKDVTIASAATKIEVKQP
jgi:hypothetical protein